MNSQGHIVKKKIRSLKDSKLRKIRYELRTLFFLFYKRRDRELNIELGRIRGDNSLSFDGRTERLKKLIKERENLRIFFIQCPINCSMCGNRMEDLIQDPCSLFWFCRDCYDLR